MCRNLLGGQGRPMMGPRMPLRPRILRTATIVAAPLAFVVLAVLATTSLTAHAQVAQPSDSVVIGHSVQGRPIEVGCIGPSAAEAQRSLLLVGGIHTGAEALTSDLALELAKAVWGGAIRVPEPVRLCVLPTLNPDGIANDTHTNANGVDLNRNWPAEDWQQGAWHPETGPVSGGDRPLSEPETRALFDYLEDTRPSAVVVLHCCGSLVEANDEPLAVDLAHAYAEAVGYEYLPEWDFYDITGEFIDGVARMGLPALDVELSNTTDLGLLTHAMALSAVLEHLAHRDALTEVNAAPPRRVEGWTRPVVALLYRVKAGDTMWGLAHRFGVTTNALAAANNITHPWQFVPGRVLAVPEPPNVAR